MAPRLSGQNSIFGVVFFVSDSLLGIEGQKKLEKFAILTRKPRSRARILIYRTWPICNLVPRAHVPFGQRQDTQLWNNQFPESEMLRLPVSQRMRALTYNMSSKVDVDAY